MLPTVLAIIGFHLSLMIVMIALAVRCEDENVLRDDPELRAPGWSDRRFSYVLVPVCIGCAVLGIAGIWVPLLGSAWAFVLLAMVRMAALFYYTAN